MEDLIQCAVARNDFQRWLGLRNAPLTVWQGEKALTTLTWLEKSRSVDYLYKVAVEKDGAVSWNNSLTFCGVYDRQNQALYLTEDTLDSLAVGQSPLVTGIVPSMAEEIADRINQSVEDMIANDRNNLPVREVTGWQESRELQYHQEYGAKDETVRRLFDGEAPDARFHSDYTLDVLPETAFMAWLQDSEGFIQTEAEQYIKTKQEKFLLQFLKNDALLAEYQALMQDTGNPIHRMKAITEAVKASGAKTVTVTIQKDNRELTFKAAADSLIGHKNYYSTYDIPAQDRREFERLFGNYASYNAENITKITYGRNTIYEAPASQTEDMSEEFEVGGMTMGGQSFG